VVSFTGTSGTAAGSGTVSIGLSGQYYINSISYSGNGGGGGNAAASGTTFSANSSPVTNNTQFPIPVSGYNPAFLALFLGSTPYPITYGSVPSTSPYTFYYSNIESGSATFTTTASVTYNYVSAPSIAGAPGPLPLLGAGAAWGWSRQLRRRCAQRQG